MDITGNNRNMKNKLPDKIEICRHSNMATIKDIIELYGHVSNCGMYSKGLCDVDKKQCEVEIYKKEKASNVYNALLADVRAVLVLWDKARDIEIYGTHDDCDEMFKKLDEQFKKISEHFR